MVYLVITSYSSPLSMLQSVVLLYQVQQLKEKLAEVEAVQIRHERSEKKDV